MPNYGDVALGLGAEWDRNKLANKNTAFMIVGHRDGVADAYLTDDPDAAHNFRWIDVRFREDVDLARSNGFKPVHKDEWTKTDELWEWDAQNHVYGYGQRLYARPADLYFAEEKERTTSRTRETRNTDEDAALAAAEKAGITVRDDRGKALTRTTRRR